MGCKSTNSETNSFSTQLNIKQENDVRHPLYGHQIIRRRLKSRKSFMTTSSLDPSDSGTYRLERWRETDRCPPNEAIQSPRESLPNGTNLNRRDWVTLNRARARVGRTGDNLQKWGLAPSAECPCGHPSQTMKHILRECPLTPICTDLDLFNPNETTLQWIQCWRDKI